MNCYLIRSTDTYSPDPLGACDLLVVGEKIVRMGPDLSELAVALGAQVVKTPGRVLPGLIDQHMHYIGGGDGDGPNARQPEIPFTDIASSGITTAVGILGSEMEAKTLPVLLRRAHELDRLGLETFIYSGAMEVPGPSLTQSIRSDIVLIDKVIGAKAALAERIYPNMNFPALAQMAGQLMQARSASGKASVLHMHIGSLPHALRDLRRLFDEFAFPIEMAVPSHANRSLDRTPLFLEMCDLAKQGMVMDITCCLGPLDGLGAFGIDPVEAVKRALDAGVPLSNITLSGDTGVAVPSENGWRQVPPSILFRDLRRLVEEAGLGWHAALLPFTRTIARVLGLSGRKGALQEAGDADMILLDEADNIAAVLARGRAIHDPNGVFKPV